ncbi:MAG TPA: c-type cytochrome [Stenomitos sp.]
MSACTASNPTGTSSSPAPTTMTEAQLIERGKYLAVNGECIACHTPIGAQGPDMTKVGAGGNAWLTPTVGIGISANLTPYEGSKVKTLSAADLAAYWKETTSNANGTPKLLPPMPPMTDYSDEDLTAIAAYFKSLPVQAENSKQKSFVFAAHNTGDTDWPQPAGDATASNGFVVPGSYEAVANFPALTQDVIDGQITAAKAGH